MRPPICEICGRDFRDDPSSGRLVTFSDYEALGSGRVGHPKGREWFCSRHIRYAEMFSNLESSKAILKIKQRILRDGFITALVSSFVVGCIALLGSYLVNLTGISNGYVLGGILGGFIGIITSIFILVSSAALLRSEVRKTATGGIIGFCVFAILELSTHSISAPSRFFFVSILCVGIGFLLGRWYAMRP